jgi:hypothetical protein
VEEQLTAGLSEGQIAELVEIPLSTAIFMSDQRADSIAYSRIPYATEQGIFRDVSGKFFQETGNLIEQHSETAEPASTPMSAVPPIATALMRRPELTRSCQKRP